MTVRCHWETCRPRRRV